MPSITVRRTWLDAPVRQVVGVLYDYLSDDSEKESDFDPRIDDDSRWYLSHQDGELAGAFWLRRVNHITWEMHANVLPEFWGDGQGTEHCRQALDTMIHDTGAKKVIAIVPTSCPQVMRAAEQIGFVREGVSVRSWQKGGKLYDLVHYGITRT